MVPSLCLTFALPVGSFFRVYLPFWLGLCIDVCLSLFTSNSAELDVFGCVFICVWISTRLIKRLRFAFMSYSVLILCFLAYVSVPLTQFSFVFFPFVWRAFNWNFINIDFWITYFRICCLLFRTVQLWILYNIALKWPEILPQPQND